MRISLLVLTLCALGCRSPSSSPATSQPKSTHSSVTVQTVWVDAAGKEHLVGGLFCQLFRLRVGPSLRRGLSDGLQPLVFADLDPGRYQLVVLGEELEVAEKFEIWPDRGVTVVVKVSGSLAEGGERLDRGHAEARRLIYTCDPGSEQVDLLQHEALSLKVVQERVRSVRAGP